jgi:hypothetical protein
VRRALSVITVLLAGLGATALTLTTAEVAQALPTNCAQPTLVGPVTCSYTVTGAEQTFSVPAGVTSVNVVAIGGAGGPSDIGVPGGRGAQVSGIVSTVNVPTLYVEVGGTGAQSFGGFNGGGSTYFAGGGGGASDVRVQPRTVDLATTDSRQIVAAGGGGGSGFVCPVAGVGGGAGLPGAQGSDSQSCALDGGTGGGAGTATGGGAAGSPSGFAGSLGVGGGPGTATCNCAQGAGGGGLWGGGAGGVSSLASMGLITDHGGGGGGGGSSLVPAGGTGPTLTSAAPSVTITYSVAAPTNVPTRTMIISTTPEPSQVGQSVIVNYSVNSNVANVGVRPTGTVTVTSSDGASCSGTVGAGSCTVTFATSGTKLLTATYGGDSIFAGSSNGGAPYLHTVTGQPQTITVTSSPPSPAYVGSTYTPTATAPGGTVAVSVDVGTDGYGTAAVACTSDGTTVTFTHAGSCVIDLDQPGNATYAAAPTVKQTVTASTVPATVGVALSSSPVVFGQPATATVTVTAVEGTAAGTVQFAVDGADVGSPVALGSDGTATSSSLLANGSLALGAHTVTATYAPNDTVRYAGGTNSVTLRVDKAATSTALNVGATTLSAAVSAVAPAAGVPTGMVTFSVDGQPVGSAPLTNGSATLPYTLPAGPHDVAAQYGGDADFAASSSTVRHEPSITAGVVNTPVSVAPVAPAAQLASTGSPISRLVNLAALLLVAGAALLLCAYARRSHHR